MSKNLKVSILGLLLLVTSVVSGYFINYNFVKSTNQDGMMQNNNVISASSIEDWSSIYTYSVASSKVTITGLTSAYSTVDGLVIPSYIGGYPVTTIGENAFKGNTYIEYVHFDYGSQVTLLDSFCFDGCTNLTFIQLPDSVEDLGWQCLLNTKLESLLIPQNVKTIHTGFGTSTLSLKNIFVDSRNSYFKSIDGVLFDASGTKLVSYPSARVGEYIIPQGVTSVGALAFRRAELLTKVVIPDTVVSLGIASFQQCKSLTEIIMPNSIITVNSNAFDGCTSLETVKLSENLTSIANSAFTWCTALKSIVIPEGVTTINTGAFRYCNALTAVVLPTTCTSIGTNAFASTAVIDLVKPNNTISADSTAFGSNTITWHSAENIFTYEIVNGRVKIYGLSQEGNSLPAILVPVTLGGYPVAEIHYGWGNYGDYNWGNCYAVGFATNENLTYIGNLAFNSAKFNILTIPSSVTSDTMFVSGLENLRYVYVEDGNITFSVNEDNTMVFTANGTKLSGVVAQYPHSTLVIPDQVTSLNYRVLSNFANVSEFVGLEHVTPYPSKSSDNTYITGSTTNSKNITHLVVPAYSTEIYASVHNLFWMTSLVYSEGIETIYAGARGTHALTSLSLPSTLNLIKSGAFVNVNNLTSVVIPSGCTVESGAFPTNVTLIYQDDMTDTTPFTYTVADDVVTITGLKDDYADITSVVIPNTIAGYPVTTIGPSAFYNKPNITSITFEANSNVTTIYEKAFSGNTNISEFTLPDKLSINTVNQGASDWLINKNIRNYYTTENCVNFTAVGGVLFSKDLTKLFRYPMARTGSYIIPSHVTEVCARAFSYSSLTEINFHKNVTKIGGATFQNASSNLTTVNFPHDINLAMSGYSFHGCNKFNNGGIFVIPNGTTTLSRAFLGYNYDIHTIVIPASCTTIKTEAVVNLTKLKNILFLGDSITIESNAFRDCTLLSTVVLPAGDNTMASDAFPNGVTTVKADEIWNATASGTGVSVTLKDEYKTLTGVIVPQQIEGFNVLQLGTTTKNTNIMACAFVDSSKCSTIAVGGLNWPNLEYIKLPDSLTTAFNVFDSGYQGSSGSKLTELYIPNNLQINVDTNNWQYRRLVDGTGISKFILNDTNTNYKLIDGNLYTYDGKTLVSAIKTDTGRFVLPQGVEIIGARAFLGTNFSSYNLHNGELTTIRSGAFRNCNITDIVIPDTVTHFKEQVFYMSNKLHNIIVHDELSFNENLTASTFEANSSLQTFKYPSVTKEVNQDFRWTSGLELVLMPEGLLRIKGEQFNGNTNLQVINIPSTVIEINVKAFMEMPSLSCINLATGNTNYKIIEGGLYTADGTTLIKVPANYNIDTFTIPAGCTTINDYAFQYCTGIKNVIIPNSVLSIGKFAFHEASSITNISMSANVNYIGESAFQGCGASVIEIPAGVTTLESNTFGGDYLNKVIFNEGLTTIKSKAFNTCSILTDLVVNGNDLVWLPLSATNIASDAFYKCPNLNISYIPEFWTRIEDEAFMGNTSITELFIPNTVTYVGTSAFKDCVNLQKVVFEEESPLTFIGGNVFQGCTSLKEVVLPDKLENTSSYMFDGCINLPSIELPSTINLIMHFSFSNTSSLTNISLPSLVTGIRDYAFQHSAIKSIVIPQSATNVAMGSFFNCDNLTSVTFAGNNVTSIDSYAFYDCDALTTFNIPSSVDTIGDFAFYNCDKLTEVRTNSITSVGNSAFEQCTELTTIDLSNVTSIGGKAFFRNTKLANIGSLSNLKQITGNSKDTVSETGAFGYCTNLTGTLDLSSLTHASGNSDFYMTGFNRVILNTGMTYLQGTMFYECDNLEEINLDHVQIIYSRCFYGCDKLKTVNLESVKTLGGQVFQNCTSLSDFGKLGSELELIPVSAFSATALKNIDLSNCTSLTTINSWAFYNTGANSINFANCSKLTSIGESAFRYTNVTNLDLSPLVALKTIGAYGFSRSTGYDKIIFPENGGSLTSIGERAFNFINETYFTFEINASTGNIYRPVYNGYNTSTISFINHNPNATGGKIDSLVHDNYRVKDIYISAGFDILSGGVFAYARNVKNVYIGGAIGTNGRTAPVTIDDYSKATLGITPENINVYVADADVNAYKADVNWKNFNILPHSTQITVTFVSAVGEPPVSQTVTVGMGKVAQPSDMTTTGSEIFTGYHLYHTNLAENNGYHLIEDWDRLILLEDTTIYGLWDNIADDVSSLFKFGNVTYDGIAGYQITGYTDKLMEYQDIVIPSYHNGLPVIGLANSAFRYAYWLRSVKFEEDSPLIRIRGRAFEQCYQLRYLELPSGVNYIEGSFISGTNKLKNLIFKGNVDFDNLFLTYTTFSASYLETFELIDNENYKLKDGIIYDNAETTIYLAPRYLQLDSYTIPSSVDTIKDCALSYQASTVFTITLQNNFKYIGTYAFYLANLDTVEISHAENIATYAFYFSTVKQVTINSATLITSNAFATCQSMTDFTINAPNFMGNIEFSHCTNLINLTYITGNPTLPNEFLYGCDNLEVLKLGNITTVEATSFYNLLTTGTTQLTKFRQLWIDSYITTVNNTTEEYTAVEIFSHFPEDISIIVSRECFDDWFANREEYNLYNFKLCTNPVVLTFVDGLNDTTSTQTVDTFGFATEVTPDAGEYEFLGWTYLADDMTYKYFDFASEVYHDLTLYASYNIPDEAWFEFEINTVDRTATIISFHWEAYSGAPLTIPETIIRDGVGYSVTTISDSVFEGVKTIGIVNFPSSIKVIGDNAFKDSNIMQANFSSNLTSIGNYAFAGSWLGANGTVIIPNTATIGEGAFSNCTRLYNVAISSGITTLSDRMFYNSIYLEVCTLPNTLTSIGNYAFYNCTSLIATSGTTSTYYSPQVSPDFEGEHAVFELPSNVKSIGDYAFGNTSALRVVTGGNGLKTIGANAYENSALIYFNFGSITNIGEYAFSNTNLYSVTLQYATQLGNYSFKDSAILKYVYMYSGGRNSIAEGAFYNCTSLSYVSTGDGVKNIGAYAFYNCINLTDIYYNTTFINRLEEITYLGDFAFCNATSLNLGNDSFVLNNIEYIGEGALMNSSIVSVIIGAKLNTISQYSFKDCMYLSVLGFVTSANADGTDTGVATIGEYAFSGCSSLGEVVLPDSLSAINEGAFMGASITKVTIPAGVSMIDEFAFANCENLTAIEVDNANSTFVSYDGILFYTSTGWTLDKLVAFPEGKASGAFDFGKDVMYTTTSTIGAGAFAYNDQLSQIVLPNSLTVIEQNAFLMNNLLTTIEMPSTITNIGSKVFAGCSYLSVIKFTKQILPGYSPAVIVGDTFLEYDKVNEEWLSTNKTNVTVYVNENDLNLFRNSSWQMFNLVGYSDDVTLLIVTLENNGGTGITSVPVISGATLVIGSDPTKIGFEFNGWYVDEELTTLYNFDEVVLDSMTLYAGWTAINYNINYYLNGATALKHDLSDDWLSTTEETYTRTFTFSELVSDGGEYLHLNLIDVERTGYIFLGWYRSDTFDSARVQYISYDEMSLKEAQGSPIELYAKWQVITYNVDFVNSVGYSASIINGYYNPVNFGENIKFTYVFTEAYNQNYQNDQLELQITIANEDVSVNYEKTLENGVIYFTIYNVLSNIRVELLNANINVYTISFASNLSEYATNLQNMPSSIKVLHGESMSNTLGNYKLAFYGNYPTKALLISYFQTVFGIEYVAGQTKANEYTSVIRTNENAYIYAEYLTFEDYYNNYTNALNILSSAGYDELRTAGFAILASGQQVSTPTVTGYTFASWNLTTYVNGNITVASFPYNMTNAIYSDITLSATWNTQESVLRLYLNGGSLGANDNEYADIYYNIEQTFMLPYNTDTIKQLTRKGYGFAGWYDNSNFEGNLIESINAGTFGFKEFWAKWEANTYKITYQPNGGDVDEYYTDYTVENEFELQKSERAGYEFVGWYLDKDCVGDMINYINLGTIGNMTLYAKWTPNIYVIEYNLLGNNISEVVVEGDTVSYVNNTWNVNYTFSEVNTNDLLQDISRLGYTFAGWYDSTFTTKYDYLPAGTIGKVELWAKWATNVYTIDLDYNIDKTTIEGGDELPDIFEFTFEDFISTGYVTITPETLTIPEYYFTGWYNGNDKVSRISSVNYDITALMAKWSNAQFDLYVSTNDIDFVDNIDEIVKIVGEDGDINTLYDGSLRFMVYFTNPAYNQSNVEVSYKMNANFIDLDSTTPITMIAEEDNFYYINDVTGHIKIFIDGLTLNTYTVKFLNTDGSVAMSSIDVTHGENISTASIPTKNGYTFDGWYFDTAFINSYNTSSAITSDITLYAKWVAKQYTMTITNNVHSYYKAEVFSADAPLAVNSAPWEIEGYDFIGFSIDGGALVSVFNTTSYTKDISVIATYTLHNYTITYSLEEGGIVDAGNPTTYTMLTETITLSGASRTGYEFQYWTNQNGKRVTEIVKGSTGDIILTANFVLKTSQYVEVSYYDHYSLLKILAVPKGEGYATLQENSYVAPAKVGYEFTVGEWYTDIDLTNKYDFTTKLYESINLYAKYEITIYNIEYNYYVPNKLTENKYLSYEYVDNDNPTTYTVETPFRLSTPVATGYTFLGWFLDNTQITTLESLSSDLLLTAKFDYTTYYITYTIEEGLAIPNALNPQSFVIDSPEILLVAPENINEDYEFKYWANTLDLDEVATVIESGTTRDIYVTAVFKLKERYVSVNLYIDGNYSKTLRVAIDAVMSSPSNQFSKTGYKLDTNWYLDSEYQDIYDFNTVVTTNLNLYSRWIEEIYTINYNFTQNIDELPSLQTTYSISDKIKLPMLIAPVGYIFDSWYINVTINNDNFDFTNARKISEIYSSVGDLTLVAKFDLVNYIITYDLDDSNVPTSLVTTYNINSTDIDLTDVVPTKEGYKFLGWQILYGDSYVNLENNIISSSFAKDIFIKANFEFIPTTGVLTRYVDGNLYVQEVVDLNKEFDTYYPVMAGYEFDGWYANSDCVGDKVTVITEDAVIYGKTTPLAYNITYASNMDVDLPKNPTIYNINSSFELLTPETTVGYTFDGWYIGATFNAVTNSYSFDNATLINGINNSTEDLKIVAKFSLINYTITYHISNGINNPNNKTTYTVLDGILSLYTPTLDNKYEFLGWQLANSEEYITELNSAIAQDLTIYARYKEVVVEEDTTNIAGLITLAVSVTIIFFGILTYSIIGTFRKRHLADSKRIEELLFTLNQRNVNKGNKKSNGYRDDFEL